MLAVAILVIDQAIIQPQLVRLNFYAPAINVAGRQRMLSQKVTKNVLALAMPMDNAAREDRREQLMVASTSGARPIAGCWKAASRSAWSLFLTSRRRTLLALMAHHWCTPSTRCAPFQAAAAVAGGCGGLDEVVFEGMEPVVGMLEQWAGAASGDFAFVRLGCDAGDLGLAYRRVFRRLATGPEPDTPSDHEACRERVAAPRPGRVARRGPRRLESRVATRTRELVESNRALQSEIAEREAAEKRMRELSGALAHASHVTALGQLATGLAHEINQPLASITNYADALELSAESGTLDAASSSRPSRS